MAKVLSFIKKNLQGSLIATLIISFLSETYFFHADQFIVTKALVFITIFIFALIQHFEDKGIDIAQTDLTEAIKSFLKDNYKSKLLWGLLIIALGIAAYYGHLLLAFALFAAIYYPKRRAYKTVSKSERAKKLKAKGLTQQDIDNIEFVKKWEETRLHGLWKYCVQSGGIIAGALLSFPGGVIVLAITHKDYSVRLFPDLSDMFAFIAYSYLTGAVLGIILYRILWMINERRFLRLTDPLNTIFTNNKESFSDLI
jgi:hypothetical protein